MVARKNIQSFNWSRCSDKLKSPPLAGKPSFSSSISSQKSWANPSSAMIGSKIWPGKASPRVCSHRLRHQAQNMEIFAQVRPDQWCRTDLTEEKGRVQAVTHQLLAPRQVFRIIKEDFSYYQRWRQANRLWFCHGMQKLSNSIDAKAATVHLAQSPPRKWLCSRYVRCLHAFPYRLFGRVPPLLAQKGQVWSIARYAQLWDSWSCLSRYVLVYEQAYGVGNE